MEAATENSRQEGSSFEEMNSCATAIGVDLGRFGATATAGGGSLAVQQFFWAVLLDSDGDAQQLCAALYFICRQVPNGASNVPIKTMAIVARWKTPRNMFSGYHGSQLLR
jgi:hypothetical protein